MVKVVGMLVALAMFCAMPAVAFAGGTSDSGNTTDNQSGGGVAGDTSGGDGGGGGSGVGGDGSSGDGDGGGGEGEGGEGGDGGDGGDFCGISQGAGEDANAECNLDGSGNTTNEGDTFVDADGDGVDDDNESDGVESVDLARTGFDVGVLALFGGIALASGLALLLVQRRRIS